MFHLKSIYSSLAVLAFLVVNAGRPSGNIAPLENVKEVSTEYCNARFQFCLYYDGAIFTDQYESDNGDGIYLSNWDQSAEMWAFGSQNVLDQTLEEYHALMMREFEYGETKVTESESSWKSLFYESRIRLDNGSRLLIKSFKKGNTIISLSIKIVNTGALELETLAESTRFEQFLK